MQDKKSLRKWAKENAAKRRRANCGTRARKSGKNIFEEKIFTFQLFKTPPLFFKIQGTYFEIRATNFKIQGTYFSPYIHALILKCLQGDCFCLQNRPVRQAGVNKKRKAFREKEGLPPYIILCVA